MGGGSLNPKDYVWENNLLILTRKIGESVIIGDDVRVVVLEVRGKQIRLGVEAPMDVVVLRDEIFQRLTRENLQSAGFHLSDLQAVKKTAGGRITTGFRPWESPAEVPRLAVESAKLGSVQVPEDQIITFEHGLLGFNGFHRCALLAQPEISPFLLLQCLDNPDSALAVVEPSALVADFHVGRLNPLLADLKARGPEDLQAFVTLTIPHEQPGDTTANLVSPILINLRSRLGKQVVLENQQYSHKHRLLTD